VTRVYFSPGANWRNVVSLVILVVVGLFGVWELWSAYSNNGGAVDWLFGVAFVGGSVYGLLQLINDHADRVMTFDFDQESGATLTTLWRPFGTEKLKADRSRIVNWRFHVKIGNRNARTFFVYADHKDYPQSLQFELRSGIAHEGLRQFAPEAIAEFEQAVGITPRTAE